MDPIDPARRRQLLRIRRDSQRRLIEVIECKFPDLRDTPRDSGEDKSTRMQRLRRDSQRRIIEVIEYKFPDLG